MAVILLAVAIILVLFASQTDRQTNTVFTVLALLAAVGAVTLHLTGIA